MLVAIAILLIIGVLIDWAFRRVAVPGLVGLLIVGVIGGPFLLGWISPSLIAFSEELRLGALIIILLRAGLEVSRESLRQVGGASAASGHRAGRHRGPGHHVTRSAIAGSYLAGVCCVGRRVGRGLTGGDCPLNAGFY
ncbi:cation:proton antiporter [Gammaproteobacteria bacterium]|nr:cation:proton antiporter [Gammaproteobacteria bacterium]